MPIKPVWMDIAIEEMGVQEVNGPGSNPRILQYWRDVMGWAPADDSKTPWCSIGACWVMEKAGYSSPKDARARRWLKWGFPLVRPLYGSVIVMPRGDNPLHGHVSFYVNINSKGQYVTLGANQENGWNRGTVNPVDVLGFRYPVAM